MGYRVGAYHMKYEPRTAIKSQALADSINDWAEIQAPQDKLVTKYWTMHFDASRQLQGSGAGVVLTSPQEKNSAMFCNYNSSAPTMQQNMKAYSMGYGWLARWA